MARRKGYIFTNKKHSEKGIMGMILGIISMVSLILVVVFSYYKQGEAPAGYGVTGLLAGIFSMIGLILTIPDVRNQDTYHLFSWIGILLNGLSIAFICLILYAGAYL